MVTEKNFKAIAEIVANSHHRFEDIGKSFYAGGRFDACENIAEKLVDYLATQNPRFDRQKFLDACGL